MAQGQYSLSDIDTSQPQATQKGSYTVSDIDAPQSLMDKVKQAGATFWDTLPGIGSAHQLSGAVQNWAQRNEPINRPQDASLNPTVAALKQFGTGSLADIAGLVRGATSPAGVATTAATIAAPEIMGPALVGHGVYSGIKGWGDLKNPDVLQNELNSAAEIVGGTAVTGSGVNAIRNRIQAKAASPVQAQADFTKAVPPTKSAPYQDADYQAARPYLESEHGNSAITNVTELRDSADSAIGKIEDRIESKIASLPRARFNTSSITNDVESALQNNPRGQSFVNAGLKELDDFNFAQPKTLQEADAIRKQLNAENKAVLKGNNYDVANARATNPAFAAREAAAESLRQGIYDQLLANGMPEARQLRLDEGSLIKIRNAANNQVYSQDRGVGGTAPQALLRNMARKGATVAGAAAGSALGPIGAAAGAELGGAAGELVSPKNLTRSQLVERSFRRSIAQPVQTLPVSRPLGAIPAAVATNRDLEAVGLNQ